jgi:DNA-binding MarR family transcriptional regulator
VGTAAPGRGVSPEPIRVGADFATRFPGCDPAAAEAAANVVRLASEYLDELNRRRRDIAGLSASGFEALAILAGAGEPLTGSVIAQRLLVTTASITSLLDTLAARGYVVRARHPDDRRKVLVELTDAGARIVRRVLPVVYGAAAEIFGVLDETELAALVQAVTRVRRRIAETTAHVP